LEIEKQIPPAQAAQERTLSVGITVFRDREPGTSRNFAEVEFAPTLPGAGYGLRLRISLG